MSEELDDSRLRKKALIAGVLGACATLLFVAEALLGPPGQRGTEHHPPTPSEAAAIQNTVDTLLVRHALNPRAVKSWWVLTPERKPSRIEQRVAVSHGFLSLVFNSELNRSLAGIGAHVVATERTKEKTVTMHIVKGGVTVRSLSFVTESKQ